VRRVSVPTGKYTNLGAGAWTLTLTHDVAMNQAVHPVAGDFVLTGAGVPHVPTVVQWSDATHLTFLGIDGDIADPCYLTFPTSTATYITVNGLTMDPYGPIHIPDPPLLHAKFQQWLLSHPAPMPPLSPAWLAWVQTIP